MKEHRYQLNLKWTGNTGHGTRDYRSYERSHLFSCQGKPDLLGSSDPQFQGDASKYNPEELLLASLAACHMLWYLHICSDLKVVVLHYEDLPGALLTIDASGTGRFKEATLQPTIVICDKAHIKNAERAHETAHKKCFIANSINFPVIINPTISVQLHG